MRTPFNQITTARRGVSTESAEKKRAQSRSPYGFSLSPGFDNIQQNPPFDGFFTKAAQFFLKLPVFSPFC